MIECREKCGHAPFKTPQGEATHHGRVHSLTILSRAEKRKRGLPVAGEATGNGHALKSMTPGDMVRLDRRSKEWREAHPDEAKPIGERSHKTARRYQRKTQGAVTEAKINYCPQCGCNIHAIAMGMVLAANMKG